MEFKLQPLEVPDDEPLRFDALNRRASVEALATLVRQVPSPFVMAIDAPWGSGKTTFVHFLRATLAKSGLRCLYFNAWETDFAADPLVAFLGELNEELSSEGQGNTNFKTHFSQAKRIATVLAKKALPVATKIATAGVVDLDDLTEEAISDFVSSSVKDAVDSYSGEKALVKSFRSSLSKAIDAMGEGDIRRITIFVDELDRCRPTYAVALLERIKHLFNIENVVFVISLDKQQLAVSLGSVYGQGINASEYLRRFIDIEYALPAADPDAYTKCLYMRFGFDEFFSVRNHSELVYEKDNLLQTFSALSKVFDLSLRAREQCFTRIRIALMTTPANYFLYPNLLVILAILQIANPKLYREFAFGDASSADVVKFIGSTRLGVEFLHSHHGAVAETYLLLSKGRRHEDGPELLAYHEIAKDETKPQELRDRAAKITEIARGLTFRDRRPPLNYVVNKLELAAQFTQ